MMTEIHVHPRDENERYMRGISGHLQFAFQTASCSLSRAAFFCWSFRLHVLPVGNTTRHGRRTFWTNVVSASVSDQHHV
jgi:hypothetical protein